MVTVLCKKHAYHLTSYCFITLLYRMTMHFLTGFLKVLLSATLVYKCACMCVCVSAPKAIITGGMIYITHDCGIVSMCGLTVEVYCSNQTNKTKLGLYNQLFLCS